MRLSSLAVLTVVAPLATQVATQTNPLRPLPRGQVVIEGGFWGERLETNRATTLPHCFRLCEETGRIRNFAVAGGLEKGEHAGYFFNDSDVFKIVEGACLAWQRTKDPALRAWIDAVVAKIAAAQESDGYLYTARTLQREGHMPPGGKERWSDLGSGHELYCAGHLYEAAVAHFEATGTRTLLEVATKHADLVLSIFGPGKNEHPDGHPEVELALVRLARACAKKEYLELARFFVEARGRKGGGRSLFGEYAQDHQPFLAQTEPVGHAVRAAYLYCGAADLAAADGDRALEAVVARLWSAMLAGKVYLTGGIGSRAGGEAFGDAFELPNERAYAETCAGIANALLAWRRFLATGSGDDFDVLERALYNGTLAGLSLSGDRFFYPNPLASRRGAERSRWFDCACCPSNVVRILERVPDFTWLVRGRELVAGLYHSGRATIEVGGTSVVVRERTTYPWSGVVEFEIEPAEATEFTLALRIPGFARGVVMKGGLYRHLDAKSGGYRVLVDGEEAEGEVRDGFLRVSRTWKKGSRVRLELPMAVRKVVAREEVESTRGRVAFERGPLVYCAEACDHGGARVQSLVVSADAEFTAEWKPELLGGVTALRGKAHATVRDGAGVAVLGEPCELVLVPYARWANRGRGAMAVWLPRELGVAEPAPAPTLASRGKLTTSGGADPGAMVDQLLPARSNDHDVPFFHWWPKKGSTETVELVFEKEAEIRQVEVFWFEDEGVGECRLPRAWKLSARVDGVWQPLCADQELGCGKDAFQRASFAPLRAEAIRLEVVLQPNFSAGIHELRVGTTVSDPFP